MGGFSRVLVSQTTYKSELVGPLLLQATDTVLVGCRFLVAGEAAGVSVECPGGADGALASVGGPAAEGILRQASNWLDRYFAGGCPQIGELPLAPQGAAFQLKVWRLLQDIPYGETTTYGALAARIAAQTGKRMSAQAVGGAVGKNPLGVIVPCHRVMGAAGNLTGFAGGIEAKVALLRHEGVDVSSFWIRSH